MNGLMNTFNFEFCIALTQAVTAWLIVLNPLALVPMMASVTGGMDTFQQRRFTTQVVLIGTGLLLLFTFGGSLILQLFGITLHDLRVAGGLLLLSIGFSFVFKGRMADDTPAGGFPSAAPFASPILVGPGAITTAVVLEKSSGMLVTAIAVAIASLVTWLIFRSSRRVYGIIRESGADVLVRVMGILLAAIAVVYIRQGIFGLIHMSP